MMRTVHVLRLAVILSGFSVAHGAELRGTVAVAGGGSSAPPRYVVRSTGDAPKAIQPATAVAVAVERIDRTVTPHVSDTPSVMAQENMTFVPNLVIVPVGGVVSFPNHDPIFHNVFSYSRPKSFDLGRYPKGQTRTVRFNESGIVRVFCEIHSSMYATIVITNSNTYKIINSGEGFEFPDLEPGRYRVMVADARGRFAVKEVDVRDQGEVALVLE